MDTGLGALEIPPWLSPTFSSAKLRHSNFCLKILWDPMGEGDYIPWGMQDKCGITAMGSGVSFLFPG